MGRNNIRQTKSLDTISSSGRALRGLLHHASRNGIALAAAFRDDLRSSPSRIVGTVVA